MVVGVHSVWPHFSAVHVGKRGLLESESLRLTDVQGNLVHQG